MALFSADWSTPEPAAKERRVTLALLAVLLSAACAGTANILQARAARGVAALPGLHPGLLVRLMGSAGYRAALALIAAGMLLAVLALRVLPVFLVQAGRAASLGVTALLSIWMLGVRPRRSELAAVAAVGTGLVGLALSAHPSAGVTAADAAQPALVVLLAGVVVVAAWVRRRGTPAGGGLALAVTAGLCYAILAVAARMLRGLSPASLVGDPAAWTMAVAGVLGLLLTATALQQASAVSAVAALVASETVVAAGLGVLLCGDRPAPGGGAAAVAGFLLITVGAVSLARFAVPQAPPGSHSGPVCPQ